MRSCKLDLKTNSGFFSILLFLHLFPRFIWDQPYLLYAWLLPDYWHFHWSKWCILITSILRRAVDARLSPCPVTILIWFGKKPNLIKLCYERKTSESKNIHGATQQKWATIKYKHVWFDIRNAFDHFVIPTWDEVGMEGVGDFLFSPKSRVYYFWGHTYVCSCIEMATSTGCNYFPPTQGDVFPPLGCVMYDFFSLQIRYSSRSLVLHMC